MSLTRPRLLVAYAGVIRRADEGHGGRHRLRLSVAVLPRMRCSRPLAAHLYPLRTSPRRWRPTSRPCAPPRVPLRIVRLVRESGVAGDATDAAPSRAGPRRNVGSNYVRPATGQRRITARVMRSFGRRLPHTLPFPAHPRVAFRPKSPAPAVATLFGLPATLRAGTEAFCSLGAALGESGRDGLCERRRKTLCGTQERPLPHARDRP